MRSLRRQLTRELLIALALLFGAALLAIYVAIWIQLVVAFDTALDARTLAVSALVEQEDGKLTMDFSDQVLRGFSAGRARYYFELRDAANAVIARSPSLRKDNLPPRPPKSFGRSDYWSLTLPNGRPGRAVSLTFAPRVEPDGARSTQTAILTVAVDREDLDETLWGLFAAVAGCGALLLAAVFFVVPRVLRRGLVPLDQLGEQAVSIDASSLGVRFAGEHMPAELRPICARLNDLLARLEASFERERRFSADLAHELRTPLAELRSLAECALKWPDSRGSDVDQDTLDIALQMEALVTRLLTLARGERGQLAARAETIELAQCTTDAWRPFASRAAERSLTVQQTMAPCLTQADPVLLRSILTNLFDNAVDYSIPGALIEIRNSELGGVRIANPNTGLSAADLPQLFDRFWRKEAARSGEKHAGLGLSLARAFAAAMEWRLTALLENGKVVFTLDPVRNQGVLAGK